MINLKLALQEEEIQTWGVVKGPDMWNANDNGAKHLVQLLMVDDHNGVFIDFTKLPANDKQNVQQYLAGNIALLTKEKGTVAVQLDKGYPKELLLKTQHRATIASPVNAQASHHRVRCLLEVVVL